MKTDRTPAYIFGKRTEITVQGLVDFLNELLVSDRQAVSDLLSESVIANKALAAHPTVECDQQGTRSFVSFLGLINGAFGFDETGGAIEVVLEPGKRYAAIERFKVREAWDEPLEKIGGRDGADRVLSG